MTGLKITVGQRTMTGQKCLLSGHFFPSPVHIFTPSNVIADVLIELKHETMIYRNKFLIVCFIVSVSVSMTGQKQILTGHFDRRPISHYFDPCMTSRS